MKRYKHPVQNFFRLGLFGLCIIFIILLWQGINIPASIIDKRNTSDDNAHTESHIKNDMQNFTFPEFAVFDEIIKRPLFNETRQPFVATTSEIIKKATLKKKETPFRKQEQLVLSAIVITPDKQIAILQSGKNKNLQRVGIGDIINGWTLNDVTPNAVQLNKGNEIKNLELEIKGSMAKKNSKTR